MLYCPQCGQAQICPCKACIKKHDRPKVKPWVWIMEELIKCSGCGLTHEAPWWEKLAMDTFVTFVENDYYANNKTIGDSMPTSKTTKKAHKENKKPRTIKTTRSKPSKSKKKQ